MKMEEDEGQKFELYSLKESSGKEHTFLSVPRKIDSRLFEGKIKVKTQDAFNILMADTSGSMSGAWGNVVEGWNANVKDHLTGVTKIYTFDNNVRLVREGTHLAKEDFSSGGTDLTSALRTIREEVEKAKQNYIRVFLITDGAHGSAAPYPDSEIQKMNTLRGKTIDVFLLGISRQFPVNISINLRSRLHNGSANMPSLFWGKDYEGIGEEFDSIGRELQVGHISLTVTPKGYVLPGIEETSSIHLGEWMYFPRSSKEIMPITIAMENKKPIKLEDLRPKPVTMKHLLDHIYRQWNTLLIQRHRNKEKVPLETFDMMKSFFDSILNTLKQGNKGSSITARLEKKNIKTYETAFNTLMNQSKTIIGIEGKFKNELELANAILKTTVTNRKYDTRNLKMKGHVESDYKKDVLAFTRAYEANKAQIEAIPTPDDDDCCRVTITSTLKDLQDDGISQLFEEDKFSFLKNFSISGIPIYAPIKDASQINPWAMSIKSILVTPFTILSTQALEYGAEKPGSDVLGDVNKEILLQPNNEDSRFNAIIPIASPPETAEPLKAIIRTNLFTMCATFAILKNPHILDTDAHMAALGVAWLRTIRDFKLQDRPAFAVKRLECIDATAMLYMDRKGYARYSNVLLDDPRQALMTESSEKHDGANIKCESFIKPMFFYHLMKDKMMATNQKPALSLMIFEFIGRCLTNYKMDDPEASRFTDFFSELLADPEKRKEWVDSFCQDILSSFQSSSGNLLNLYFTLDELNANVRDYVLKKIDDIANKIDEEIDIAVNFEKVKRLKNTGSCGDVTWASLHAFAAEMGLSEEERKKEFSHENVLIYVSEALKVTSSKERLSKDHKMPSYKDAHEHVKKKVIDENTKTLKSSLKEQVLKMAHDAWRKQYMDIHGHVLAMPMTDQEIIAEASTRGIKVDSNTFKQIYKYNSETGLLRNACQIPGCPHYLKPRKDFNQHLAVEREAENFPHSLHLVSSSMARQGVNVIIGAVANGQHSGTKTRKKKTPPKQADLEPLKKQIETLTFKYQEKTTKKP